MTDAPLLASAPTVITVGAALFEEALVEQAADHVHVNWQPPESDVTDALAAVAADRRRGGANVQAVRRLLDASPALVDVRPAREVLDLRPGTFLHAGPPIAWDRASGPLRGALIGAMLYEGLAATPEEAQDRLTGDAVRLMPCHQRRAVGPMAGVVSPSMWMFVVEDTVEGPGHGGTAYCSLNEGLGRVLRYGAYGPEVVDRLRWMSDVLGPVLSAALRRHGPVDVKAMAAQALQMGDELHNRNRAATSLLVRELAADLVSSGAPASRVAEVLRFMAGNDHFFLNIGMAAAKVTADAARNIPGSTVVVAMARNGTDFGIQVSGTGDRWFTAPAAVPHGLYLGSYGPDDANPDIGDSTIAETTGVGGFAMAAAPAIVRFVGGEVPEALAATRSMYEITLAEHPAYQVPVLDFRGTPTGIDATLVVRTGLLPVVNTGIAGRVAGTGQVGAGLAAPPREVFAEAVRDLAADVPTAARGRVRAPAR
ncbi:MAG: DUF1116 domain-containing protein [Streptosporangiaceae bacterium]